MSNTDPNKEVVTISDKTFQIIKETIDEMVDFIKPTYGPASNKVIIAKTLNIGVLDDGVQIARDYESNDPAKNAIVNVIREVAIRTNDRAGDGTTSSLIMLQAIFNEVDRTRAKNGRKTEIEIKKALKEAKEQLLKQAKKISTLDELTKVAMVSFDDEKIAGKIAKLYEKIGVDGVVTVENSPTMETTIEQSDGIKIDKGYVSPYMINNPERMETVVAKPYILITDYRLTEAADILPIMDKMLKAKKLDLVVIAENIEQSALSTMVINRVQGKFNVTAITSPVGDDRSVILEDIAMMTGATFFSESKGNKIEDAEISDLGRADKFICRREESIIVGPKGNNVDVEKAKRDLRLAIDEEPKEVRKKEMKVRLGRFNNSIAVVKVGALTQQEQKTLRYKVEDSVNSVKSALKNGVVCGGGLALSRIKTSSPILNEALQYPKRQLFENMNISDEIELNNNEAFNVVTGKKGGFMEVGVVDPVDVLLAGIESAVSIASILLTSSGMLVEQQKEEKK